MFMHLNDNLKITSLVFRQASVFMHLNDYLKTASIVFGQASCVCVFVFTIFCFVSVVHLVVAIMF